MDIPSDFSSDAAVRRVIEERVAAVEEDPSSASAHLELGLALSVNGAPDLAAASFAKAVEIDGELAEAHYQIARLDAGRGDTAAQSAALNLALTNNLDLVAARFDLACLQLDEGDLDGAASEFQRILDRVPDAPLGKMGIGLVALERGQLDAGIKLLRGVLKDLPGEEFVRFRLGQAYARSGDEARAAQFLGSLSGSAQRPRVRSEGDRRASRYEVGRVSRLVEANDLLSSGKHLRAEPILAGLHEEHPEDFEVALSLAAARIAATQPEGAIEVLEKADKLRPSHHVVAIQMATCALLMAEGRRKDKDSSGARTELMRALEWADRSIAAKGDFGKAHARRGAALMGLNRDSEALAALRRATELGEIGEGIYVDMVRPARRVGGGELAARILREGIAKGEGRLRLRFELCGVLLQDGRGAEARAAQQDMARVAPKHPLTQRAHQLLAQQGL